MASKKVRPANPPRKSFEDRLDEALNVSTGDPSSNTNLTLDEETAIYDLQKLAKKWPKSLWLFAGDGLSVMKTKPDGMRAVRSSGGTDPAYKVASIKIPSDGGDW